MLAIMKEGPFSLVVDFDQATAKSIVQSVSYSSSYAYSGPQASGVHELDIELVCFGVALNSEEARGLAEKLGYLFVNGRAVENFRKEYPWEQDNKGSIVFLEGTWMWLDRPEPEVAILLRRSGRRQVSFHGLYRRFNKHCRFAVISKALPS